LITGDGKIDPAKTPAESCERRADLHSPFGPHSHFQNDPDLCFGTPAMLSRSYAKGAMRRLGQISDSDDSHIGVIPM